MSTAAELPNDAAMDDVPFPSWQAWNRIRNGEGWPGFEHEREIYEAQKAIARRLIKFTHCVHCQERFDDTNCHSEAGWQETQISGLCERCFDEATDPACRRCGREECRCDD